MPEFQKIEFPFHNSEFEIKVTTFQGLESVLADELLKLGGKSIQEFKRGVSVTGDWGFVYKCNYCLRTAIKVLVPIHYFKAQNAEQVYDAIYKLPWETLFLPETSFLVESVVTSAYFNNSMFCNQRVKDAIVDRFRNNAGKRPNVDRKNADVRVYAHVNADSWMLALDTSGDPLYKRGYKTEHHEASMKEVLAAGLLKLSGWSSHQYFLDGMSGSGTIAMEAALLALQIPSGMYRSRFAFECLLNFNATLWTTVKDSAISRIKETNIHIQANDLQFKSFRNMQQTVIAAQLEDSITCTQKSFFEITPEPKSGVVFLNPPYGERLPVREISDFYKDIGNTLKRHYSGYTAWIISSNTDALKQIGLKPSKKYTVYNGALECKFLGFELYDGSRKFKSKPL